MPATARRARRSRSAAAAAFGYQNVLWQFSQAVSSFSPASMSCSRLLASIADITSSPASWSPCASCTQAERFVVHVLLDIVGRRSPASSSGSSGAPSGATFRPGMASRFAALDHAGMPSTAAASHSSSVRGCFSSIPDRADDRGDRVPDLVRRRIDLRIHDVLDGRRRSCRADSPAVVAVSWVHADRPTSSDSPAAVKNILGCMG